MMRSAPEGTLIPTYDGQRPAYSDYLTGADGDPITRDNTGRFMRANDLINTEMNYKAVFKRIY